MKYGSVVVLMLSLVADFLLAHPLDVGYLQVNQQGETVSVELDLHPKVSELLIGSSINDKAERSKRLLESTLNENSLLSEDTKCRLENPLLYEMATTVRLKAQAHCPVGKTLAISLPFLKNLPPPFQIFLRAARNGEEEATFILSQDKPSITFRPESSEGFWDFIHLGIQHIGALPSEWWAEGRLKLPDGIDHILFLLALILGGGTPRGLIKTITGFTIGHSITLALGAFGLVNLPSRLVESCIALSIAYVALHNIRGKNSHHGVWVAFAFGLIHGLGFASHLSQLHLSPLPFLVALVGFNGGVEIGQIMILTLLVPALLLSRHLRIERLAIPACSLLLVVCGSYWFFERLLG